MARYVEVQNDFRVKIKYNKSTKCYNLRLQKKWFCFWRNINLDVDIKEGFWGEESSILNPISLDSINGRTECYKIGTADFNDRAQQLYEDYIKRAKGSSL